MMCLLWENMLVNCRLHHTWTAGTYVWHRVAVQNYPQTSWKLGVPYILITDRFARKSRLPETLGGICPPWPLASYAYVRLSCRISPAILKEHSLPTDVAGIIKCDSCILYTQRGRSRVQHFRDREADAEGAKIGAWCIWDAPKARPAGPSPHLGCVFVQRHRKRQMAIGYCSFVEERWSSDDARRAEPTSPFSWRLLKNAKF